MVLCPLLFLPGVLLSLVAMESATGSSEDLSTKCRRALKSVVAKLTSLPALDALVHQQLPESVMKMVLEQVSIITLCLSVHTVFMQLQGGFVQRLLHAHVS